ncbi:hypothetical protein Tsubulata_021340 [Turnera subulata]|uniref:Late embryogenesis abundant protein LEA-2 subgroup domain-containing protein n=1 Tax=Turnera subulata TaxID=218843 RepID=A0A9Q0G065_9ROSI|nr:hypothetical protein Tsubulata_021340 [Turnera subulata]
MGIRVSRGLKICALVTALFVVIIAVVLIILYFTVFKPRQPTITPQPVILENFRWSFFPIEVLNITLGIAVTIDNHNYGSFKYDNSTAYLSYDGNVIGEAPVAADKIPARGKHNVSTTLTIYGDKLLKDDKFKRELFLGSILNFTSASTLHGKVTVLKLFKAKATSFTTCNVSIFVQDLGAESVCKSKVRL